MSGSKLAALAATLGLALAACSGGSMSPAGPSVNPGGPAQGITPAAKLSETPDGSGKKNKTNANAISAVNALGTPVKTYNDENTNEPGSSAAAASASREAHSGGSKGVCRQGIEFYAPDRNNDPDSTETLDFFDAGCTQLARDTVRKYALGTTTGTETVNRVATSYAIGSSTPVGVRTDNTTITNGTFGKNGFPVVADGFQRETSSTLVVGSAKNVLSDTETVMQPSTTNVNDYCTDAAGYNSLSISKLGLTFGWQGGAFTGGTRTLNPDTSVTWSATHTGSTESAPEGTFSIATGATNTVCPIVTPAYTLSGGTTKGTYTIPITITYKYGVIRDLVVTNATLSSGYTLNVTTNTSEWPANQGFIDGTVTDNGTTVAIFNVSAFGYGKLTVASTGNQFPISDWSVVR